MDKGGLVRHIFLAEKQRFSLYLGDETRAAPLAFFHKELFEVTNKIISVNYIEHLYLFHITQVGRIIAEQCPR